MVMGADGGEKRPEGEVDIYCDTWGDGTCNCSCNCSSNGCN